MKVLVISQPKSGTYLCANLLQQLGLNFTGLHISKDHYQKYDLNNLEDCKTNGRKYTTKLNVEESIKIVKENQFAVSHLRHSKKHVDITSDFKKIILTRNYDEVIESWERWATETNRNFNSRHIDKSVQKNILNWLNESNIFHLTFNNIYNKNILVIDNLQNFLFGEVKVDSLNALTTALDQPSLTKSRLR